ncbi:MAG: 2-amino-4-hydroxy-6-hydroxymethyldihydropteridine diphosphokinase [Acidobacteriota bacterium]
MRTESVFIGLGSNRGNRAAHLRLGLAALQRQGISLGAISSLYLTEPVLAPSRGNGRHPWYLNCVATVESPQAADEVLRICLEIEKLSGRVRDPRGPQPRPLDLDLLLYGTEVIETTSLQVPHPRLHERRFALLPLSELAPEAVHPTKGATVEELLAMLPPREGVWLLAPPLTIGTA